MPRGRGLEFIDFNQKSIERLKALNGIEVLTPESEKIFLKWCDEIRVNKRVSQYHPLVYQRAEQSNPVSDSKFAFENSRSAGFSTRCIHISQE
jgi:hypothetical protein